MSPKRVIGVDLGGTKIAAAAVGPGGELHGRVEVPTPVESQAALLEAIAEAIGEAAAGRPFAAIGFGIPSVLDRRRGVVVGSNNIPLGDVRLGHDLAERYGVPVVVENDGNVAALAEWRLGAGRDVQSLVMLTLGTGVGGGVILDSGLYRGWAELGHVVVVADGPPCQGACTGRGHLEALVSGNAADRAAEKLWGEGATAELLVGRAEEGDADALEALSQLGHLLGIGVGSIVNVFAPELVVVGGGFGVAAFDLIAPSALDVARREALEPASSRLRLVPAELGPDAGLVGAGLLALETLREA